VGAMAASPIRSLLGGVALVLLLAVLLWAPICDWMAPRRIDAPPGAAHRPAPRTVLLVSIDGLAARVLEEAEAPFLRRLAREGSAARRAETVVPSYTLSAHTSMLSGVGPGIHGVGWNRYEPWRGEIPVPTIYSVCADRALRCGLFAGKRKFAQFAAHEAGIDRYAYASSGAGVLAAALEYLRERAPDFALLHLPEVDWRGHDVGWSSRAQLEAIAQLDAQLAEFTEAARAALGRPLALIVTSDHGGHGTSHGSDLPDDLRIPWIAWGDGVAPGQRLGRVGIADTAPSVLSLLGIPNGEGLALGE
jgi:hypothetical protein